MIESLNRFESEPHRIFVICMDELTRLLLRKLNLPNVELVALHSIEQRDVELLACKDNRTVQEYLWTTTPTLILRILESYPGADCLTYLDADMLFYSDISPVFDELGEGSVLIHEHRFPQRFKYLEKNGIYNVGLLAFRYNSTSMDILRWWRERCIEWCYLESEDGKMGDQGYLNDWPTRFPGVVVTQNIGVGAAPWNIEQYDVGINSAGTPLLNGVPLILYHFHGYQFANPLLMVPCADTMYHYPANLLKFCIEPYANALIRALARVQSIHQDFSCGLNRQDLLSADHTFLAHRSLEAQLQTAGIPQSRVALGENWWCYYSPQVIEVQQSATFPV